MVVGDFGKLIALVRNLMMAKLDDALKAYDLTSSQYGVLKTIVESKADTLATLCETMQHDKGAMSRILSRMEEKSLIVRKPCPDDGRAFKLALSDKALALYPQTVELVEEIYGQALKGAEPAEREQFFSVLEKCRDNLS
ncbi:MarR family winged helix-turn-helix transcriptional regulator [Alteromonas lipolytica]|uniref:HTH marR-type domain-containing protein n=1 Tax=Alteromonas lipolytica TaxID=1856405 RepID=A0A1E8FAP2_9ALTE|nr:MarR family transcriptional regulator [Alteromonas lipolytica]OFI32980.1 hypothetical protein BFC17_01525 [Alteromonas lipolytica]GGF63625.1 hypothetical protein GCM10011338_15020 [Alteromonas lipolytica]